VISERARPTEIPNASVEQVDTKFKQVNGELAAMVTLGAHGNAWLQAPEGTLAPSLDRENSSFQYVREITFQMPKAGLLRRERTAHGITEWLQLLRDQGVHRLYLAIPEASKSPDQALSPHIASAFANGGQWGLLAASGQSDLWTAQWEVGDRDAPDSRLWDVQGTSTRVASVAEPQKPDLAQTRADLLSVLGRIGPLAESQGLSDWVPWFDKAIGLLDDADPVAPYHQDLLPAQAPLENRQLAAASIQAFVFGGMGSWNDVWLSDPSAKSSYDNLSAELYTALLNAFLAVVNQ
jgi:hypothetical protein